LSPEAGLASRQANPAQYLCRRAALPARRRRVTLGFGLPRSSAAAIIEADPGDSDVMRSWAGAFYQRVKALARFIKPEEIRPGRDSNGSSVRASSARQHAAESSRPRVRFGAGASRPPTRRRRAHERRRGRRARRQARRRRTATTWTTARTPRRRQRPRPRRRGQRRRRQTGSRRARGIASRRVSVACAADAGCGQAVVMLILLVRCPPRGGGGAAAAAGDRRCADRGPLRSLIPIPTIDRAGTGYLSHKTVVC